MHHFSSSCPPQRVPNAPFAPLRLQFHLPPGYLTALPLLFTSLTPFSAPALGSLLLASYCNCFPESCLLYPLLTPQPPEELSPMPIVTLPRICANNLQIQSSVQVTDKLQPIGGSRHLKLNPPKPHHPLPSGLNHPAIPLSPAHSPPRSLISELFQLCFLFSPQSFAPSSPSWLLP